MKLTDLDKLFRPRMPGLVGDFQADGSAITAPPWPREGNIPAPAQMPDHPATGDLAAYPAAQESDSGVASPAAPVPGGFAPADPAPVDPERVALILAWGEQRGWPEVQLTDWSILPSGETRWRMFAEYLLRPGPNKWAEHKRLQSYSLAVLKILGENIVFEAPIPERCRCGSTEFKDVLIHDGASTRRDCARCGRFVAFVRWYGKKPTL